ALKGTTRDGTNRFPGYPRRSGGDVTHHLTQAVPQGRGVGRRDGDPVRPGLGQVSTGVVVEPRQNRRATASPHLSAAVDPDLTATLVGHAGQLGECLAGLLVAGAARPATAAADRGQLVRR